jgi:hypothetical protein
MALFYPPKSDEFPIQSPWVPGLGLPHHPDGSCHFAQTQETNEARVLETRGKAMLDAAG